MCRVGVSVLLAAVLILSAAANSTAQDDWTILVYIASDNNLEAAGIDDINEMEAVADDPDVNIVVQVDRIPGFDSSNGDWTNTRRYLITHDTDMSVINSTLLDDMAEQNMGDPQTFVDFVTWGIADYPADHYFVILWDHGGGWRMRGDEPDKAVCWDDTDGHASIEIANGELTDALEDIEDDLGRNIDILGFDACLMGMIEVGYACREHADWMIASEPTEPFDGWPFDDWLTDLDVANGDLTPEELGTVVVQDYCTSYDSGGSQCCSDVQLALTPLSTMNALAGVVNDFAVALICEGSTFAAEIQAARDNCQEFCWSSCTVFDHVDLSDFADEIAASTTGWLSSAASDVVDAVDDYVEANCETGSDHDDSHGLAIYHPRTNPYSAAYDNSPFAVATVWDEFLSGNSILTVLSPNGGEELYAGCTTEVEWESSHPDVPSYVRIRISLDGGATFETLESHVPNTGSETVTLPCAETTAARILVEGVDCDVSDMSDGDFSIIFPTITVTAVVDEVYDPPNPWTQDGLVIDYFDVSCDADLFYLHFVADPLQDPSVPCEPGHTKMISGDLVEFVPEVIDYLEAGETATIEIKIVVPVGQHTGDYEGLVHVLAEPECACPHTVSENFEAFLEVEAETDVDFADDRGNVSRDLTLHLVGAKLDDVSGTITVVNPDSDENNADMADGPGNVRIDFADSEISDLVKIGDPAVTISGSSIALSGDYISLASGEAMELGVSVAIPDGIPTNATYMGTVTLTYESCLGGQEVSDTFTILLEVLPTQGALDIVASEVNLEFCYTPPWLAPGEVLFDFDITAIGDHRNIRVSTGGLEHPTLPTKLEDFAFFPEEIAFLAAGETRTVDVIVTIPIGQHAGLYSGYVHIVSENGGEDDVLVTIDICGQYDLDIRDNYANLSGNVMEISCTARANQSGGEWALRAFDIGLPDGVANNYDDFDGPGNAPIDCLTYEFDEWSFMWQNDDQGHNYHLDKVFTGEGSVVGELCGWSSGEFRRLLVAIFVPKMTGGDNHPGTYKGRLDCWANVDDTDAEVGHDFFDIEVHLSRVTGHESDADESEFGGYPDDGGARLYWGHFDQIGLMGAINLYRADIGSGEYVRINSAPLPAGSDYLDTEIEAGTEYNYRLGIGTQGSEFFIGPVAVGGAPKFAHLSQSAPNPFRYGTEISYQLPSRTHVSLRVYDVSGRLVRILKDGEEPAGFYTAVWDRKDERGREVAGGVYFYRYATALFEETRKMVVLH